MVAVVQYASAATCVIQFVFVWQAEYELRDEEHELSVDEWIDMLREKPPHNPARDATGDVGGAAGISIAATEADGE